MSDLKRHYIIKTNKDNMARGAKNFSLLKVMMTERLGSIIFLKNLGIFGLSRVWLRKFCNYVSRTSRAVFKSAYGFVFLEYGIRVLR